MISGLILQAAVEQPLHGDTEIGNIKMNDPSFHEGHSKSMYSQCKV